MGGKDGISGQIAVKIEIVLGLLEASANVNLTSTECKLLLRQCDRRIGIRKGLDELLNKDAQGVSHRKEDRRWMPRRRPACVPIELR